MSADQYTFLSPRQRHQLEQRRAMADTFPDFHAFGSKWIQDFKSVSFFIGDRGDVMVLAKRFSDGGELQILWSSGDDVTGAIINLDNAMRNGEEWRKDKPRNTDK